MIARCSQCDHRHGAVDECPPCRLPVLRLTCGDRWFELALTHGRTTIAGAHRARSAFQWRPARDGRIAATLGPTAIVAMWSPS